MVFDGIIVYVNATRLHEDEIFDNSSFHPHAMDFLWTGVCLHSV